MDLVFATGNPNKVREIQALLPSGIRIQSLKEIGCEEDIPETAPTLDGNALQKAEYVKVNYSLDCFSEDTGLEVEALNGDPGVLSARYAGPHKLAEDNITLLLKNMEGEENRKARFRTVICLILNGEEHYFEGVVNGTISTERMGEEGFGYDPIFIPEGYDRSFAQMSIAEKNEISHRGRAVKKLVDYLSQLS